MSFGIEEQREDECIVCTVQGLVCVVVLQYSYYYRVVEKTEPGEDGQITFSPDKDEAWYDRIKKYLETKGHGQRNVPCY